MLQQERDACGRAALTMRALNAQGHTMPGVLPYPPGPLTQGYAGVCAICGASFSVDVGMGRAAGAALQTPCRPVGGWGVAEDQRLVSMAAAASLRDPAFLGYAMAAYMRRHGLGWVGLAEQLHTDSAALSGLALQPALTWDDGVVVELRDGPARDRLARVGGTSCTWLLDALDALKGEDSQRQETARAAEIADAQADLAVAEETVAQARQRLALLTGSPPAQAPATGAGVPA